MGVDIDELELRRCLEEVMGEFRGRVRIRGIKEGTLFLDVESPVFASEVRLRKEEILAEMERRIGRRMVKEILCI